MIANYYGLGLAAWSQLTNEQQTAITFAYGQLSRAGLESTGFRVTGPVWKPGDLVVTRFRDDSPERAFFRGPSEWVGATVVQTDAAIDRMLRAGNATLILRDGQLTDDGARMAGERLADKLITRGRADERWPTNTRDGILSRNAYVSGLNDARKILIGEITSEAGE